MVIPVVVRELRTALRNINPAKRRFRNAGLLALVAGFFLLIGGLTGSKDVLKLFQWALVMAGLYFAIVSPFQTCSALFSEERRNDTLELLFLTGLSAGDIF